MGKRACHFDTRLFHFHAKVLIRANEAKVENCLVEKMAVDHNSKPLLVWEVLNTHRYCNDF